jgi:hypothetical protein
MLTITQGALVCPRGVNHEHVTIPIADILKAESREQEVAIVTKLKAPELLFTFNDAWRHCHDVIVLLTSTLNAAKKAAKSRKGVVTLEVAPVVLQEKGIASTADSREAVLDTDPEYLQLLDEQQQIEAAIELFKGKLKGLENAFTSVKALVREDNTYLSNRNSNLSGDTGMSRVGS